MNAEATCAPSWLMMTGRAEDHRADAVAIQRARNGDRSAFDEIVRRHQGRVYNLAYRMLRHPQDAEDVTQEAFLKAFGALPRLKNERAFASWLGRIAANLCLMRLRSAQRAETLTDPAVIAEGSACAGNPSSLDIVGETRAAIAKLPPKYRLAVVAFYLEGRSCREGARLAGVPVLTFKTRLYRARKLLRDLLGEVPEGPTP
ncbi:MAG TPA: sigma-70 family RNA polymerase sigma factor [Armatimonadota bacterium]|nr:sigma-70 family RNA polymerase sigma factor [Armatimonadota bacterium]